MTCLHLKNEAEIHRAQRERPLAMTGNHSFPDPVGKDVVHLCVDMQRMFAEETDWIMPWSAKVLPRITVLVEVQPANTIFTRFIPAGRSAQGSGKVETIL